MDETLERVEAHDACGRSGRSRASPCRGQDRRRPGQPACRGSRWRRSSAASPRGNARQSRPAGCSMIVGLRVRDGAAPADDLELACRSCCSLTELGGRIDRASAAARAAGAAHGDQQHRAPARRRESELREEASPCVSSLIVSSRDAGGAARRRRRRPLPTTRWFRDTPSASPRRRSRSRAWSRVPCRSAR